MQPDEWQQPTPGCRQSVFLMLLDSSFYGWIASIASGPGLDVAEVLGFSQPRELRFNLRLGSELRAKALGSSHLSRHQCAVFDSNACCREQQSAATLL